MPSGKKTKQARRATGGAPAAGPRRTQSGRRNRWWLLGGAGVVVVAAIVVVAVVVSGGGSSKPPHVAFASMPNLQTGPPPWNNDIGDLQDHLDLVKLDALSQEALAFHIHAHLDAYINGKHVTVPAGIGINTTDSYITEVHTHTPDGVIHVESPVNKDYVLGQFFGEWGVRLTSSCIGSYCGSLHWWLDGKPQTGDPADLELRSHEEIVIASGKPPAKIPSSYTFPQGE